MDDKIYQRGFVTIASVMVLLAVGVAAALVAFLAAWQSVDGQYSWTGALRAQNLADACTEIARAQLWQDVAYAGSESFEYASGRCAVLPVSVASSSYDVYAEGVSANATARTHVRFEVFADASGSVQTLEAVLVERVADF